MGFRPEVLFRMLQEVPPEEKSAVEKVFDEAVAKASPDRFGEIWVMQYDLLLALRNVGITCVLSELEEDLHSRIRSLHAYGRGIFR